MNSRDKRVTTFRPDSMIVTLRKVILRSNRISGERKTLSGVKSSNAKVIYCTAVYGLHKYFIFMQNLILEL